MNSEIEKQILNDFIVERKSERLSFELSSRKKRRECIWGLNISLFKPNYCEKLGSAYASPDAIARYLKSISSEEYCYVLSIDEQLDGRLLKTEDALNELSGRGPFLLSFEHGGVAYFEEETETGAPDRYLLVRKI